MIPDRSYFGFHASSPMKQRYRPKRNRFNGRRSWSEMIKI